ncbi:hypothetical protein AB0I53_46725 [Saccharopolyspora sp. NPDC050389]|uniref:hypothetical protein n=1 Tax=Saccharopolyspora sp. NPDC050389 TaxID=3155516 RepID=UPI0033F25D1E
MIFGRLPGDGKARQLLPVICSYSKENFVDHEVTDRSSVPNFIEDDWHLDQTGDESFDTKAGRLDGMFDFGRRASP